MRKKQWKQMLALLLAAACLTTAACGTEGDKGQEAPKGELSKETGEPEGGTNEGGANYWELLDQVSDTSELPDWTGDTLEVTVWYAGGTDGILGGISDTNVTFKELERVTGVRFNVDDSFTNGGDNIDAVLPRLIAGKNFPTMIYGWDIPKQFRELYDNGYLADLTKYYENGDLDQMLYWMPLDAFESSVYRNAKTEEGNYYLLPAPSNLVEFYDSAGYSPQEYDSQYYNLYGAIPLSPSGIHPIFAVYVRDDILKALYPDALTKADIDDIFMEHGSFTQEQIYDVPLKSQEDFMNMLRDMKELLKSGEFTGLNGREVEVTYGPHTGTDNWNWIYYLPKVAAGFANETDPFVNIDRNAADEDHVLLRSIDMEQYKDWMKSLNTLVNEDVISQNSLVDNAATFDEKYLNGQYAVVYGGNGTVASEIGKEEGLWSYRPLWVDVPVDESFGGLAAGAGSESFGIFRDSLSDQQLDQLIHAINYLYSKVGTNNFIWGPETAGLFTENADGSRTYTNKEVEACAVYGESNNSMMEFGLYSKSVAEQPFTTFPICSAALKLLSPGYLMAADSERTPEGAYNFFNPGTLPGKTFNENVVRVATDCHVYSFGATLESLQQFWGARAGFENQMKKVMAATPENFEKEYANLIQYADDNMLTEETVREFNDLFVEENRAQLKEAGILK